MPRPSNPPDLHWQVWIMRGKKAERLGIVRAPDEGAAVERACEEFELAPWQRRRVLVRREG